jgi:hypothetical protein
MGSSCVTVTAAVFTTLVGIDAPLERNIRTINFVNNTFWMNGNIPGSIACCAFFFGITIVEVGLLAAVLLNKKGIGRICLSASAFFKCRIIRVFWFHCLGDED